MSCDGEFGVTPFAGPSLAGGGTTATAHGELGKPTSVTEQRVLRLEVDPHVAVDGDLVLPDDPAGLVVFAHGSGSSRHSPRNRAVAATLNRAGFATLLLDLLTADEER